MDSDPIVNHLLHRYLLGIWSNIAILAVGMVPMLVWNTTQGVGYLLGNLLRLFKVECS
jgi:hypothetical protein